MSRVRIVNETDEKLVVLCAYGEDEPAQVVLELPPGVWYDGTVPLPYWRIRKAVKSDRP